MKYLYVGIAILAICLAACTASTWALSKYTDHAVSLLEQAQLHADAGSFQQAEQLVRQAKEFWQDHHGFFGVILRHDEADQINATFWELVEYAQNNCSEEFEPSCAMLIEQINHLSDMEKPHYYNVLAAAIEKTPGCYAHPGIIL